jgi:hypothetical protein
MAKSIRITCPSCRRSGLRMRPEYLGRNIQCKHCGASFRSSQEHFTLLNRQLDPALKEVRRRIERLEARLREAQAELDATRAHLGDEAAGLRSAVEDARRAMAEASRQAGQGARAAAEALVRADRAGRAACGLRVQLDRLGSGRPGGQDEPGWALGALDPGPKDVCPRSEPEPGGQGTLAEAIADLELRFLDILSALNATAESGRRAGPGNRASRNGGPGPEEAPGESGEGEGRPGLVGQLAGKLAEARRSNQRLCSLLGVLGMSQEAASKMTRPDEAPS